MTFCADTASAQLVDWMSTVSQLRAHRASIDRPLQMHETADELVLRRGRFMLERAVLDKAEIDPKSKVCYLNAFVLFRRSLVPLHYCEGNVVIEDCPIPVMHGWCVDDAGQVHDPSVEQDRGAVYYGIQYEDAFARDRWKILIKKHCIGILPNTYIFREPRDWLEAGIIAP